MTGVVTQVAHGVADVDDLGDLCRFAVVDRLELREFFRKRRVERRRIGKSGRHRQFVFTHVFVDVDQSAECAVAQFAVRHR